MLAQHRSTLPRTSRYLWLAGWGCPIAQRAVAGEAAQPIAMPTEAAIDDNLLTSGFFLELGFSFVVGLAMGYALKIAFKIALVVAGVALLSLFALQYVGVADVNWSGVEIKYDGLTSWLIANGEAFKDFISEHLSSAASFTAGLLVGLKL